MLTHLKSILAHVLPGDPRIKDVDRFVELHDQGLERVLSIVDGTASYDQLIAEQINSKYKTALPDTMALTEKRQTAIQLAQRKLARPPRRLLVAAYSGFVCDGKTKNNLREFDHFDRLCATLNPTLGTQNYTVNPKQTRAPRPDTSERALVARICTRTAEFYQSREDISAGVVNQQIAYSMHFISFLRALCVKGAVLPKAFVQANDHWPARVARSMVMKGLGIPRIYLQHAEVTDAFPPLDFEYSILRNQRSLETYARIGPVSGQTFVIARDLPPEGFAQRLMQDRSGPVSVVIYPTARILRDRLIALLKVLSSNAMISNVVVKRHPRALPLTLDDPELADVKIVDDVTTQDHIAIVGNSSVALELLASGVPVYQNFEFDPIRADYYGFVNAGLTKTAPMDQMHGHFWPRYEIDEAWRLEFQKWIPGREESEQNLERLLSELTKLTPLPR